MLAESRIWDSKMSPATLGPENDYAGEDLQLL
jgi:hypothetical protein